MDQLLLEAFYVELERRFGDLPMSERPVFGVDERMRCERVLRLPGPWSMYRMRESLRACVVRRERQGAAFELAFNTVFGIEKEADLLVELPRAVSAPERTDVEPSPVVARRRLFGVLGLVALVGAGLVGLHIARPPEEPIATPPQVDERSPEPPQVDPVEEPNTDPFTTWEGARRTTRLEATFTQGHDPRGAIAAGLAAFALMVVLGAWRWKRQVDAERLPPPEPPELADGASLVALTVDAPRPREELLDPVAADALADAVGILLDVPVRPDLDVSATIGETARRGGFPTPVLAGERHLHRVIVLGHTGSPARRARPVDVEIAEKLAARGVPASHAELRPGSTQVFPRVGTPTSLDRLHQNDAAAIVIVVGEPDRLEKELLRQLAAFKRVAIVAPVDPSVADPGRVDIPVFHPTEAGWKALALWVRRGVRPQDRSLPLLEPRMPPPRALEALGTGRPLQPDEERELERFLGPTLPWAAALACMPLPVGPGMVAELREVVVELARANGLPHLATGVEDLRATSVDVLHTLAGSAPGEGIDLPGALREWLWTKVLDARWPALHEALLRHHLTTLGALEVAAGSQGAIDRDFARLVLRAWLARMSGDEAEVVRVATALRNFRQASRTGDQAQVWRESLIPRPEGALSPEAARLVKAAWTDVEWEPWTTRRRALGIAALAGAVAACAGGVVVATTRERPTIKVDGDYFAWWQDGWLAVRDGAFTQTGLLKKPAAGVSGTITFNRVDDPNGPPCVEYEEPDTWWVRCGPKGEFLSKGGYAVATGTLSDFEDPRVARVLGWMFRAGVAQGAYVGKEGAAVERLLFGWDGTFDRDRLVVGAAGPVGRVETSRMLTGSALETGLGVALLTGSNGTPSLPLGAVDLTCIDRLGEAVACDVFARFEDGAGLRADGFDLQLLGLALGVHPLAAGSWSMTARAAGEKDNTFSIDVPENGTAKMVVQFGAPSARAALKLDKGVTATIDGVGWDGKVRELAQGEHKVVLGPGCPPKEYDLVVGDGEAPRGAIRLKAGVADVQRLAAAPADPLVADLRFVVSDAAGNDGEVQVTDVLLDHRADLVQHRDGTSFSVRASCGVHAVEGRVPAVPGIAAASSSAVGTIEVRDGHVIAPNPVARFDAPVPLKKDGATLQVAVAAPLRPKPCDGGALPTGGPTGKRIPVTIEGFLQPMEFVVLSGGTFAMGSPPDELGRDDDETCHRVTLSPFAIATTEVSQDQWQAVMGKNPAEPAHRGVNLKGDSFPIQNVSWCDVVLFANKLSEKTGRTAAYAVNGDCENGGTVTWDRKATGFLLPTEAQWEYAARAGTADTYGGTWDPAEVCRYANVSDSSYHGRFEPEDNQWEADNPGKSAWFRCDDAAIGLASVRSGTANPWGLHQVSGNVWEWVWDAYGDYIGGRDPAPDAGASRVVRGGGWGTFPAWARVAVRGRNGPRWRNDDLGLRLALPPAVDGP